MSIRGDDMEQPRLDKEARRARDRAQVERHVAGLFKKCIRARLNDGATNQECAARILRYLRRTRKDWR